MGTAADLDAFERDGYVVIERAVGPDVLDPIRAELAPYLDGGDGAYRGRNDFEGFSTNRVYGLLAKAPSEAALVLHPRVTAMLDSLLLPGYLLTANLAINLLPGETAQDIHFDDPFYKLPRPRPPVSISSIWAIDEFIAANGATEVIPGSHRWGEERPPADVALGADRDAGRLGDGFQRDPVAPRRRQHHRPAAPGGHPAVLPAVGPPAGEHDPGRRCGGGVVPAATAGAAGLLDPPAVHGHGRRPSPAEVPDGRSRTRSPRYMAAQRGHRGSLTPHARAAGPPANLGRRAGRGLRFRRGGRSRRSNR